MPSPPVAADLRPQAGALPSAQVNSASLISQAYSYVHANYLYKVAFSQFLLRRNMSEMPNNHTEKPVSVHSLFKGGSMQIPFSNDS